MFCGCGGLSLGFKRAGYDVVAGFDFDAASLETYGKNFGSEKAFQIDLAKATWSATLSNLGKIDVILAGPPCQGFSLTGTRNPDDSRNQLYKAVFDAARVLNPKAILIENVKGMATLYNGEVRKSIIVALERLGYRSHSKILNASKFGVPQHRERLFFLGLQDRLPTFPNELFSEITQITCGDAISDLPSLTEDFGEECRLYDSEAKNPYQNLMRSSSSYLWNHVATRHTDLVKSVIRLVPEGKNHRSLPPGIGLSRRFNEAWTRYDRSKPSRTIDTGHRNHFHYEYDRVPTIRENARLQSFPDDFVFVGTKTEQNRQVGNAVPVLLAQSIAMNLADCITK